MVHQCRIAEGVATDQGGQITADKHGSLWIAGQHPREVENMLQSLSTSRRDEDDDIPIRIIDTEL